MRLYECLLDAARDEPGVILLEIQGRKVTSAELADESLRVAAGLKTLGLGPGDSVALLLPNVLEFVAAQYGILLGGQIVVPFNVMLRSCEIEYQLTDSNVRAIFTTPTFLEEVRAGIENLAEPPYVIVVGEAIEGTVSYAELIEADASAFEPVASEPDAPIMTIYTSGTTGKPKGAQISNRNIISNMQMFSDIFPPAEGDKTLCVLPLFHVFALNGLLNPAIRNRSTVVLHPRFDADQCMKSLREDGITVFAGVPTMYTYLLKHPDAANGPFPKLHHCFCGGAPIPLEVLTEFGKVCGAPIYEGYGLTETTVSVCLNRPGLQKIGSIGTAFEGVTVRIVDDEDNELPNGKVGELAIRAPNVMLGYLNKPEETAEAMRHGWLHTGDLGYCDDDGFLYIVDRKKDMIIKGGYNIYPREIEEVIYQLPEVLEAAVIGVSDAAKGELVRAIVVLKPDKSLSAEAIADHLRAKLAKYKLPQEYAFTDQLPKGPTGKILKRELQAQTERWNRDRVLADQS